MTHPGYSFGNPVYPALRSHKKALGFNNSAVNLIEAATRELERGGIGSDDFADSISATGRRNAITLRLKDTDSVRILIGRSYIVQTYMVVERMLKRLIGEYKKYKRVSDWTGQKKDGSNLDPLAQLATNLPSEVGQKLSELPEYHVLDYYRVVRNSIVHSNPALAAKAWHRLSQQPEDFFEHLAKYPPASPHPLGIGSEGPPPHTAEKVDYSDFMLYHLSARAMVFQLNTACDLSVDDIVAVARGDSELLGSIARCSGTSYRMQGIFRDYFEQKHGTDVGFRDEFVQRMSALSIRLPNDQ